MQHNDVSQSELRTKHQLVSKRSTRPPYSHHGLLMDNPNTFVSAADVAVVSSPKNTFMRAPTRLACKTFIETIVDHVAQLTGKTPEEVRAINLAKIPPKAEMPATVPRPGIHMGVTLLGGVGAPVPPGVPELPAQMFQAIKKSAGFDALAADTAAFNKNNVWRKRGLAAMPTECKSNCCMSTHG